MICLGQGEEVEGGKKMKEIYCDPIFNFCLWKVCLLRDAAFEIAMIATSSRYIADAMWFPLEGVYIKKQIMQDLDLVYLKDKVKFFEKIKKLNINERELALFSVLALAAPGKSI